MTKQRKLTAALSLLLLFVFVIVATSVAVARPDIIGPGHCSQCTEYCSVCGQLIVVGHMGYETHWVNGGWQQVLVCTGFAYDPQCPDAGQYPHMTYTCSCGHGGGEL